MKEVIISVASMITGWFLARIQSATDRKRMFRSYVKAVLIELDSIKFDLNVWRNGDLFKWHQSSVPGIRTEGAS